MNWLNRFDSPAEAGVKLFFQADVKAVTLSLLTGCRLETQPVPRRASVLGDLLVGRGCAWFRTLPGTQHQTRHHNERRILTILTARAVPSQCFSGL